MSKLKPFYQDVQAHYDLSDDFYRLFLDPTLTYSCAYFERDDMTLEEAQLAKVDLSLGKCDLRPGLRLLDIGCGWGTTALRAADKHGVRAVGLTLSKNQHATASARVAGRDDVEFRLQGWEEFNEPVDRIVSIGALEHFRVERFAPFFARCREVLPADGKMMIHSIVHGDLSTIEPGQPEWDEDFLFYTRFMRREIFPNGQVPARGMVQMHGEAAGFQLTKLQSLRLHYARTLQCWSENLAREKDRAIAITSPEIYDKYQFYLQRSSHYFRTGHIDVVQFSFAVK